MSNTNDDPIRDEASELFPDPLPPATDADRQLGSEILDSLAAGVNPFTVGGVPAGDYLKENPMPPGPRPTEEEWREIARREAVLRRGYRSGVPHVRTAPPLGDDAPANPDAGLDLEIEFVEAGARRGDRLELLDLDRLLDNDHPPVYPAFEFTPAPEVTPPDPSDARGVSREMARVEAEGQRLGLAPPPVPAPSPRSDWPFAAIAAAAIVGTPVATYFGGEIGATALVVALVLVAAVVARVRR